MKTHLWELWDISWPFPGPGASKSQPWWAAWFFLHTPRPNKESHKLWIVASSKQVAQGQLHAACDIGLHLSLQLYLILRNKHKEAAKKGRQRNMSQMKEQENSPEWEVNEIEASNLSESLE